jgi:hypothetical protein
MLLILFVFFLLDTSAGFSAADYGGAGTKTVGSVVNALLLVCFFAFAAGIALTRDIRYIVAFAALLCFFIDRFVLTYGLAEYFIASDGNGYYYYLPEIFLKSKVESIISPAWGAFLVPGGIDKYPIGVAVLECPFFLLAWGCSSLLHIPLAGGYNVVFQMFSAVSSAFYFCLGLVFLKKVLSRISGSDKIVAGAIMLVIFCSNILIYTVYTLNFSHIYSFCVITAFICLIPGFYEARGGRRYTAAIRLGALLGLVALLRTTNALVVILFVFYDLKSLKALPQRIKANFPPFFAAALTAFIVFAIQLVYWKIRHNAWFINTYALNGEFFSNWNKPAAILKFVLSPRKGLLYWTPAWIIIHIIVFSKRAVLLEKFRVALRVYLPLQLYLCAAWWCWWYGGTFGQRTYTDILALFAIGVAAALEALAARGAVSDKRERLQHFKNNAAKYSLTAVLCVLSVRNILLEAGYITRTLAGSPGSVYEVAEVYPAVLQWFITTLTK